MGRARTPAPMPPDSTAAAIAPPASTTPAPTSSASRFLLACTLIWHWLTAGVQEGQMKRAWSTLPVGVRYSCRNTVPLCTGAYPNMLGAPTLRRAEMQGHGAAMSTATREQSGTKTNPKSEPEGVGHGRLGSDGNKSMGEKATGLQRQGA